VMSNHDAPLFVECCQRPLVLSTEMMAMPCSAPVSASVIDDPMRLLTVFPSLAALVTPSVIAVRVGLPAARTGASLFVTRMVAFLVIQLNGVFAPLAAA